MFSQSFADIHKIFEIFKLSATGIFLYNEKGEVYEKIDDGHFKCISACWLCF